MIKVYFSFKLKWTIFHIFLVTHFLLPKITFSLSMCILTPFFLQINNLPCFLLHFYRSLRCDRITIHKNLFISFIINNIVWIIWYVSVIYQPDVIVSNAVSFSHFSILQSKMLPKFHSHLLSLAVSFTQMPLYSFSSLYFKPFPSKCTAREVNLSLSLSLSPSLLCPASSLKRGQIWVKRMPFNWVE